MAFLDAQVRRDPQSIITPRKDPPKEAPALWQYALGQRGSLSSPYGPSRSKQARVHVIYLLKASVGVDLRAQIAVSVEFKLPFFHAFSSLGQATTSG